MERLTDKVRNYDGTATSKQSLVVENTRLAIPLALADG